jgi:hypothetical protein
MVAWLAVARGSAGTSEWAVVEVFEMRKPV